MQSQISRSHKIMTAC